ncbi:chemotaxis protein CheA [Gudongella oleilytica]|uniref:chemotaxis protein CheA n=1 Tax=Gudongella oleilytica TaxID=1582259 RepID=UPI002A363D83|nr:chemotaxis protein CheA [Gudongella oleilytica]MDY0256536.1 chemotaxis protein CheA [Gudongella oleilytica]
MDDNSVYKDVFLEESTEYLQILNDGVMMLERDPSDEEALGNVFRAAHTLKGMAATMGYETMTSLTHKLESVLELFRGGNEKVTPTVISLIFSSLDSLSEIINKLRDDDSSETDISQLVAQLNAAATKRETAINEDLDFALEEEETNQKIILEAAQKGYETYEISIILDDDTVMKGARAYLVVNRLEQNGDVIHTEPSPEELEQGDFDNIFKVLFLTRLTREEIAAEIDGISEIRSCEINKVNPKQIDQPDEHNEVKEEASVSSSQDTKLSKAGHSNNFGNSIRVDIAKLDNFMNLVSELVIYRNQLEDISTNLRISEINEPLSNVARISTDLQDLVLQMRMQPVSVVFNRFPRMVRDLSKVLDKEIDFQIEGEETELDRTVVSELGEPLIHLLRNAVDHGIETREERRNLKKPTKGIVKLSAYQEGNRVIITLSDDGKGLDPEKIREAAVRKGLNIDGLRDTEIQHLIFNPGFSTAKEVTSISGRGVGMDVVKQKISSLGGTIELTSEVGVGTTFTIKLPLTLSIIQSLMVKIADEVFAVPLGLVEKVVKVTDGEIMNSLNREVYMYRGQATPVIRLDKKLGIQASSSGKHLILVHLGDRYYGLLVDDLLGQQEIVIKKLSGVLGKMKEYLGATILGNGDITLILDVGNLCG